MYIRSLALVAFGLPLAVAQSAAQSTGAFIVRLGNDTTGVEQFAIVKGKAEVTSVTRSPRTRLRHAIVALTPKGEFAGVDMEVREPVGDGPPIGKASASFKGDSITGSVQQGSQAQPFGLKAPPGTESTAGSMWVMFERLSMRHAAAKADSVHVPMVFLGGNDLSWAAVRKLGSDSVVVETEFDLYHARVDKDGHILALRPIKGTQQFSLDRVPSIDVNAWAAKFAATEKEKGAAGIFSPRDTARADANGAHFVIDYGRPSKRGRVVFGGMVPWNEVWRTGANGATQFFTDKPVKLGATLVPAGKYTLWTIPTPTGWTLIVNSETGQWGTEHKAEKDVFKIPMVVESKGDVTEQFFIHIADEGGHGQWHFVWDQTVAAVDFAVQ